MPHWLSVLTESGVPLLCLPKTPPLPIYGPLIAMHSSSAQAGFVVEELRSLFANIGYRLFGGAEGDTGAGAGTGILFILATSDVSVVISDVLERMFSVLLLMFGRQSFNTSDVSTLKPLLRNASAALSLFLTLYSASNAI